MSSWLKSGQHSGLPHLAYPWLLSPKLKNFQRLNFSNLKSKYFSIDFPLERCIGAKETDRRMAVRLGKAWATSTKKIVRVLVHAPSFTPSVCVCLTWWVSLRWLLWSWMRNYFGEHGQLTCGYICEECIHASSVTYTCWWVQYHAGLLQRSMAEYNGGAWKRSHDNTPPLPALTFFLLFLPRGPLGHWGYDIDVLFMVEALGLQQPLRVSTLASYLVCRHHRPLWKEASLTKAYNRDKRNYSDVKFVTNHFLTGIDAAPREGHHIWYHSWSKVTTGKINE